MPWQPAGTISIREAVIRVAEARAPDAGVREYLAKPFSTRPVVSTGNATADAIANRIPFYFDGFRECPEGLTPPGWFALEGARGELLQYLGNKNSLQALIVDPSGQEREILHTEWRQARAAEALYPREDHRRDLTRESRVFVREAELERWLRGEPSASATDGSVAPPDPKPMAPLPTAAAETKTRAWLTEQMRQSPDAPPDGPRDTYLSNAQQKFAVSERAFLRAWGVAIAETGAHGWSKAGRKSSRRTDTPE